MNSGGGSTIQHAGQIAGELRKIEMAMGVGKHVKNGNEKVAAKCAGASETRNPGYGRSLRPTRFMQRVTRAVQPV